MAKVSQNLALFENLKEELWFSVSMTFSFSTDITSLSAMVPSQKQNYANPEETFLDQCWLTFFIRKKIQLLVMKPKNRQFLHRRKIGSLTEYFVTHSSVCNRIQTTPKVIIISIILRES